jgi:hypothetical protein
MSRKLIDIECTLVRQTERAVLVTTEVTADVWVPKSLCQIEKKRDYDEVPCEGTVTLSESYAVEKELV